jgi:serine protease Do
MLASRDGHGSFAWLPLLRMIVTVGVLAACVGPPGPPPGTMAKPLPAAVASAASAPESASERERYVVRAMAPPLPAELHDRREAGVGTGFYVAPDKVITNSHVAGNCAVRTVGNGTEGAEIIGRIVADDPADDLALLAVDVPAEPAAFETELYTETGHSLAVVGYPAHGLAVRLAELVPADARQADLLADGATYPFRGVVHPGNSGSPVLDESGAVIGVVVKKIDTVNVYRQTGQVVDDIGLAIPNRIVFAFLRANRVTVQRASPGPALAPDALMTSAHRFVRQIGCWR